MTKVKYRELGYTFNDRDIKMFSLIMQGLKATEIGKILERSSRTIESRIENAKYIMDAKNEIHLIVILLQNKIIKLPRKKKVIVQSLPKGY